MMESLYQSRFSLAMFLFLLQIFLFFSGGISDLTADRAALLAFRSAVGGRTLFWNTTHQSPCQWAGVQCDNNRVIALRLPGVSLSGQVPAGIFGNLTGLRTLSLRFNAITGTIPADLASCTELRNLYLQENHLSGELPGLLFSLQNIVRLNLAGNNFSGEIRNGFNNLTRLRTLYLENNQLIGSIPELKLPKLEKFNVSFNSLNGSVPESLESMPETAFAGNSLCGRPLDSCSGNGVSPAMGGDININIDNGNKKKKGLSGAAIAGIVIGSVLGLLLLILLILLFLWRNKSSKKTSSIGFTTMTKQPETEIVVEKPDEEMKNGGLNDGHSAAAAVTAHGKGEVSSGGGGEKKLVFFGNGGAAAARVFDLEELLRASAEVLGKGTFGTAYKAVLEVGTVVAVKRLRDVTIPEKEFREKIERVGSMDHQNLVPLWAYYYSPEEKLLVYDYMPMGSLSALLHGNKGAGRTPLNWEIRSGIALGAARGIEYLHSQGSNVSHGNIKSSNILITKSYKARVSDFGLSQLAGPSSTPNRVAGYRAPEVIDPRKISQKADVYSFGVLLLELLTGKPPTHAVLNEEGVDLPRWVQSIVKEEWTSEVFDPELLRDQKVAEEMVHLLQLAIDSATQYPDKRPSMSEVTRRIEELCRSSLQDDQPDCVDEAD